MMCHERAAQIALDVLEIEDFYSPGCRKAFLIFDGLFKEHGCIDEVTAATEFQKAGMNPDEPGNFIEECPSAAGIEQYIKILKDRAADRKAVLLGNEILAKARSGAGRSLIETIRPAIEALGHSTVGTESGTLNGVYEQLEDEISGKRFSVEWIGWFYLSQMLALLPGTVTVLCGSPGASKSLFVLEAVWRWYFQSVPVVLLALEKRADFHRRRCLAQMAERQELTNFRWCREHSEEARELFLRFQPVLDKLMEARVIQAPTSDQRIDADFILRWIKAEAKAGRRIIIIDPITKLVGGDRLFEEQAALVDRCQKLAEEFGLSIVFVTHPVKGKQGQKITPDLDNMQGSKSFSNFVDTAFWLESHRPDRRMVTVPSGRVDVDFNRTLHCLKVRNASGAGDKIAFQMQGGRLWHVEQGKLQD